MKSHDNTRPDFDEVIKKIADYIVDKPITSELAFENAYYCLLDSIGCAVLAHTFREPLRLIGPWLLEDTQTPGARVIGLDLEQGPVKAAFDNGLLIRWLDYNDTWLAREWGHPSDNLGAILTICDYLTRRSVIDNTPVVTIQQVLEAMIRAYEIQGILGLDNSFNAVGLDHVILVKVASVGIVTHLMGGTKTDIMNALSQAWVDGQALRTYRHSPNTGSRKSWAAGDAASRAVQLALLTLKGEEGFPSALTAPKWGFQDALFKGKPVTLARELNTYVMENILFKIAYPAEFHAQTAVECALQLHTQIVPRLPHIDKIVIETQEPGMRIINKTGPLYNPADRDHCLQYMVAVALFDGKLAAQSYENDMADNPIIDDLRSKMEVVENPQFTKDYYDLEKRAIPNAITVHMSDGTRYNAVCEYPLGHPRRRKEGIPLLWEKLENNLNAYYSEEKSRELMELFKNKEFLLAMNVAQFMDDLVGVTTI